GHAVRCVAEKHRTSTKVIYSHLRRYWQRGCTVSALTPDLNKCGGRGKLRLSSHATDTKLGRPSLYSKTSGKKEGIRCTPSVHARFGKGAKLFQTVRGITQKEVYERMLFRYFYDGFRDCNGLQIPVMPPAEDLPT